MVLLLNDFKTFADIIKSVLNAKPFAVDASCNQFDIGHAVSKYFIGIISINLYMNIFKFWIGMLELSASKINISTNSVIYVELLNIG